MKTFKIFVASSKELETERKMMAELANSLNTALESQGINVIVVEWENLDASMGIEHKQEEYNSHLRECELCMVLYWTIFGKYTQRELDVAYNELTAGRNPRKLYVYFKDGDKEISQELKAFRDSFPTKYGHFFSEFKNMDTLKAHFLLQFMGYMSQGIRDSKVIELRDGKVLVGGKEYISLQNVPFAGNNEEYNLLRKNISKTEKLLSITEPNDPDYAEYAKDLREMKEKLASLELGIWDMAMDITELCSKKCSERLQRAVDCFNRGDNKAAAAILKEEEIYKEAQNNIKLIKLGEEGKKNLLTNIDELSLKIKLVKPNYYTSAKSINKAYEQISNLLTKVIEYTAVIYGEYSEEVIKCCRRSRFFLALQPKRYLPFWKKALAVAKQIDNIDEIISISKTISNIYLRQGDEKNYEHYQKLIVDLVAEKYGERSESYIDAIMDFAINLPYTKDATERKMWLDKAFYAAQWTNNIEKRRKIQLAIVKLAAENKEWGELDEAIGRLEELAQPDELPQTYVAIAETVKWATPRATIKYYEKAIAKASELNIDIDMRYIFLNISQAYAKLKDVDNTINFLNLALTANASNARFASEQNIYDYLMGAYLQKKEYKLAIECAHKCLDIELEDWKGGNSMAAWHIKTAYIRLSDTYRESKDFDSAAKFLLEAINFQKKDEGRNTSDLFFRLANIYIQTYQTEKALDIYNSLLEDPKDQIAWREKFKIFHMMGWTYFLQEDFIKAEQCYKEGINLCLAEQPDKEWATKGDISRSNRLIARAYFNIAWFYARIKEYDKAQKALEQTYVFYDKNWNEFKRRAFCQGVIHRGNGEHQKAIDVFNAIPATMISPEVRQVEIARTLLECGKVTDALEIAVKTVAEFPDFAEGHKVLGLIYKEQNEIEMARRELEKSLALMESDRVPQPAIKEEKLLIDTL